MRKTLAMAVGLYDTVKILAGTSVSDSMIDRSTQADFIIDHLFLL